MQRDVITKKDNPSEKKEKHKKQNKLGKDVLASRRSLSGSVLRPWNDSYTETGNERGGREVRWG